MSERLQLPESYYWAQKQDITIGNITALHVAVGWESNRHLLRYVERDGATLLGVLHEGNLVGTGALSGFGEKKYLSNLAVHPDHRSRGIGSTIIRERVRIAEEMEAFLVHTELCEANSLVELYESLGFEKLLPNRPHYVLKFR